MDEMFTFGDGPVDDEHDSFDDEEDAEYDDDAEY